MKNLFKKTILAVMLILSMTFATPQQANAADVVSGKNLTTVTALITNGLTIILDVKDDDETQIVQMHVWHDGVIFLVQYNKQNGRYGIWVWHGSKLP